MSDKLEIAPPWPVQVDVEVTEPVSEEQVDKILLDQGLKLKSADLQALRKVGIYVRGQGVTHLQYGMAIISQQRAAEIMEKLSELIVDYASPRVKRQPHHVAALTNAFAGLMARVTDSQEFTRKLGGPSAPINAQDEDPVMAKRFRPGADVRPPSSGTVVMAQHAHFHENKDLPKKE